jgi:hypothetical protein
VTDLRLLAFAAAGLIVGLFLFVRGMPRYRDASRIGDTAVSRIASLAVGEALVSGTVVPAEVTLVSALQSRSCVFYRSRVDTDDDDFSIGSTDERAVGFRVHDGSGEIRVFPRGARFDVPDQFDERDGVMGDRPPGLDFRSGSPFGPGPADRAGQIASLLSVQLELDTPSLSRGNGRRRYYEARIESGDVVTVIGRALPFDQLADPASADVADGTDLLADPEIAADLAAARAAGILETDPAEAWGNAAIPGFGIGRPSRDPELDPEATRPELAAAAETELAERTFTIRPDELVLSAAADAPLIIALGAPAAAESRHRQGFLVGLLGAVLAIVSAMALAIMVGSGGLTAP